MRKLKNIKCFQTVCRCYGQQLTEKYSRTLCTIARDVDNENNDYSSAKLFSEIPESKGLPFFGTFFHYKIGE